MAGGIPEDFYLAQTLYAVCGQPTVRIGLPLVDAMRSGDKEPVVCGTCSLTVKERLDKTRGRESEDLPDWGSDSRRSL
jgi:hypothetical protein